MNYTGPKVKLSRRLGIALTPKAAQIMEKRPYPPGQHGRHQQFKDRNPSDFKRQLLEKQKLQLQYNIHERQMRNYFINTSRRLGNTVDNLVQLLETRLDAVVLRTGLARTIYAARQYVTHGHILVNGQRVDLPAYRVKEDDVVSVKEKSRRLPCFADALASTAGTPPYLKTSKDEMSAQLLYLPPRYEVPVICEVSLVIEYYSR